MIQKIRFWKEKIQERIDELQEKARAQWMEFNPREKLIVSILAGVMALLLVALLVKETSSLFSRVSSEAENNYKNIQRIQGLIRDLSVQRADLMKFERLRGKRGEDFKLPAFLEAEAIKYGATVAKIAPARALAADGKETNNEEWAEIQLKDTSLDSMLKFLSSIEETLGLRIVELKVQRQFAEPSRLDVTTVIASSTNI